MAPASIPPGPKANPNVVAAFFNSFMSAGEQKFTVVSSFFSSGLFLLALALVKQYSSLKELQDAHEGPPETQQQQQQLLQPLPQKQHLSQSLPQGRTGTLLTVDTKGSGLDRSRYGSNDHHQSRTSMTSLPTPAPSPPPSSSPFFSTMVGGNAQPTTPRSSSSVHTTTTMTTPSSTTAMPSKGKKKGSSSSSSNSSISGGGADVGGGGVALNDEFLRQLIRLVRKLIHSWKTREAACLGGMVFLLLARTACDLRMISLVVGAERAIVMGDRPSFRISLARFLRFMVPVACVNALLKYTTRELSLGLRQRLTEHLQAKYMRGFTFYSVTTLQGRSREMEQLMTVDVDKFCLSLTELLSNVLKPTLDILIYARRLQTSVGSVIPLAMALYLFSSGLVLTRTRRPAGDYAAAVQRREGDYRFVSHRLVTHAEEVAFYDGIHREGNHVKETFRSLLDTIRRATRFRYSMDVLDSVMAKYMATALGWILLNRVAMHQKRVASLSSLSSPSLSSSTTPLSSPPPSPPPSPATSYESFHRSARMMFNFAQALAAIVLAGREATRLTGYTDRVLRLEKILDNLHQQEEQTSLQDRQDQEEEEGSGLEGGRRRGRSNGHVQEDYDVIELQGVPIVTPPVKGKSNSNGSSSTAITGLSSSTGAGEGRGGGGGRGRGGGGGGGGRGEKGEWLTSPLTLRIDRGMHVLVTGPNGSGKSSLFRMICGLWPVTEGRLIKPPRSQLFYIPQRPYLPLGTLRDQVIYPHSVSDMAQAGRTDQEIMALLAEIQLSYLAPTPESNPADAPLPSSLPPSLASSFPSFSSLANLVTRSALSTTDKDEGGREGGREEALDRVCDWDETLSGGEKQRLVFARLLYHRPAFAILDECTSAVSSDMEDRLYTRAKRDGITLLTVAHRKSLWKHHEHLLVLDGRGGWSFRPIRDVEPQAAAITDM